MIQLGARNGVAEARNVFQSDLLLGEKSLVPAGQLFFSSDLRTSLQFTHFTNGPAENGPFIVTRSHLHVAGLPAAGTVEISVTPVHSLAPCLPFASSGRGANCAFL